MEQVQTDGMAIASLIIGFFSWVIACCGGVIFPLLGLGGVPFAIVGLVLGALSVRKIQGAPEEWGGMPFAIVGIVLNILLLLAMMVVGGLMLAGVGLVMFQTM